MIKRGNTIGISHLIIIFLMHNFEIVHFLYNLKEKIGMKNIHINEIHKKNIINILLNKYSKFSHK